MTKMFKGFIYTLVALFTSTTSLYAQEKTYKYHPECDRIEFNEFKSLRSNHPEIRKITDNIIYESNDFVITILFEMNFLGCSDWIYAFGDLISTYTNKEKIEFLIDRGILEPLYSYENTMNTKDKYYTTKIQQLHKRFNIESDSCYLITSPQYLAPIRPWNSVILTDLVNLDERHLNNEEKLKILLQRGILKKLTPKDDLKKLNKVTITYRAQNPAYVDSLLKETKEKCTLKKEFFYQWFETVRDSLEKRVENEK